MDKSNSANDSAPEPNTQDQSNEHHSKENKHAMSQNNDNETPERGILGALSEQVGQDQLMEWVALANQDTNTTHSNTSDTDTDTDNDTHTESHNEHTQHTDTEHDTHDEHENLTFTTAITYNDNLRRLPHAINLQGETTPGPSNYRAVAELLKHLLAENGCNLANWRGQWWLYTPHTNGTHQSIPLADEKGEISSWIRNALDNTTYLPAGKDTPVIWHLNTNHIKEITSALEDATHVGQHITNNTWIGDIPDDWDPTIDPKELITCNNATIYVPGKHASHKREQEKEKAIEHTPSLFTTARINATYQPGEKWGGNPRPNRWLQFLEEAFPGDADSKRTLQEWIGYLVSGRTDLQKMMILTGPSRSGKGVIANIITELLGGRDYIDSLTLQRLNETFGLANMLGKTLALVPDARITTGTKQLVQRLLSITGEDEVSVNRKSKTEITVKLDARIMITSNEIPSFRDSSEALANRMIVLEMQQSFYGKEDPELKKKLRAELGGILAWAIEGLNRLNAQGGRFTRGEAEKEAMREIREDMSPVRAFVEEYCELGHGEDYRITKEAMWVAWCAYVEENGIRGIETKTKLTQELKAIGMGIGRTRYRIDGSLKQGYKGVRFK